MQELLRSCKVYVRTVSPQNFQAKVLPDFSLFCAIAHSKYCGF